MGLLCSFFPFIPIYCQYEFSALENWIIITEVHRQMGLCMKERGDRCGRR